MASLFNVKPADAMNSPSQFPPNSELTDESNTDSELFDDEKNNIEKSVLATDGTTKQRAFQSINPTSRVNIELAKGLTEQDAMLSPRKLLYTTSTEHKDTEVVNLNELSENLRFSVNNKMYADVLFRVGPTMQMIYAHRVILAYGSTYFNDLFSQKNVELYDKMSGIVKLDKPDILPEIFLKVLEYLYSGVIRLKQDDVLEILALSDEFGIFTLKEMCSKFIQPIVDVDNSCMLLAMSTEFSCQSLEVYCLKFIDKNIERVLGTEGFLALSEKAVVQIVQRDELRLAEEEEIDIFHSILRWTKNRYASSISPFHGTMEAPEAINKELRELSKNIIDHCRFPLMTAEQLSSIVEPTNFVPKNLLFEAYKNHLTHNGIPEETTRFRHRDNSHRKKPPQILTNVTQRSGGDDFITATSVNKSKTPNYVEMRKTVTITSATNTSNNNRTSLSNKKSKFENKEESPTKKLRFADNLKR